MIDYYWNLEDYKKALTKAGCDIVNLYYTKPGEGVWIDENNIPAHIIIEKIKK